MWIRAVADQTHSWEYWQGPDKEIIYMSPSCEPVTGYTVAEFMEKPELLYAIIHPEDRHLMDIHMHYLQQHSDEGGELDFRIVRKDGTIRWIAHTCKAIYGKNGQYIHFSRVEPLAGTRWLHAEAETKPNSEGASTVREPVTGNAKSQRVVISTIGMHRCCSWRARARWLPGLHVPLAVAYGDGAHIDPDGASLETVDLDFHGARLAAKDRDRRKKAQETQESLCLLRFFAA